MGEEKPEIMNKLTSEDWWAIIHTTSAEMNAYIAAGTLVPPLRILITDGDDELFTEFELKIDGTGKVRYENLSPTESAEIPFPVTYTVTDSKGREAEAFLSEEAVSKLRRLS